MAVATLPSICIRKIINYLNNDFGTLHACILINRHWCIESINKLWNDPFKKQERNRSLLLINTYVNCLTIYVRKSLNIKYLRNTSFDYISFLKIIRTDEIYLAISLWSEVQNETLIRNKIFDAILEHLVINSANLIKIHLNKQLINIFKLRNANNSIKSIKSLKVCYDQLQFECFEEIMNSAYKISKFIENIDIPFHVKVTAIYVKSPSHTLKYN
jgi:hypothetical protein